MRWWSSKARAGRRWMICQRAASSAPRASGESPSSEGGTPASTFKTSSVPSSVSTDAVVLNARGQRGNLNTRMKKLDDPASPFAAIILAVAGLVRLSLAHRITSFLSPPTLFHAVGQGALGIEIRSVPSSPASPRLEEVRQMVGRIEHWQTSWRCYSERELLRTLEGGCSVPVGCASTLVDLSAPSTSSSSLAKKAELTLQGVVTSLDGSREVSTSMSEIVNSRSQAEALGRRVAEKLKEQGADAILEELGRLKEKKVQEEQEDLQRAAAAVSSMEGKQMDLNGSPTRAEAVELETGTKIVDLEKGELGA